MRIVHIGDNLEIDLDRVTHVTGLAGSRNNRKYNVCVDSGVEIVMLEDSDGFHPAMPRDTFIKEWKNERKPNSSSVPEPPAKRKTKSVY